MIRASETLGSASLLLTTVTVLLGLWYPEIKQATSLELPEHSEDAGKERRQVREALYYRALPLMTAAVFLAASFAPVAFNEIVLSWQNIDGNGLRRAVKDYDPTALALLAVVALAIGLAILMGVFVWELRDLRRKLRAPG